MDSTEQKNDVAPLLELEVSESVRKTLIRRKISDDEVREVKARAYWTEKTGPGNYCIIGTTEAGRVLVVQYQEIASNKVRLLHASERRE